MSKRLLIPIGVAAVFATYIALYGGPLQQWVLVEQTSTLNFTGVVYICPGGVCAGYIYANGSVTLPPGLYKLDARLPFTRVGGAAPRVGVFDHCQSDVGGTWDIYLVYDRGVVYTPPKWCTVGRFKFPYTIYGEAPFCEDVIGAVVALADRAPSALQSYYTIQPMALWWNGTPTRLQLVKVGEVRNGSIAWMLVEDYPFRVERAYAICYKP